MRRQHKPIAQDPQPYLSARSGGLSLPELITRAVLEFPDGVGMADSRGRIQFANASMERMLGYDRGELIGVHISRLHPPRTDGSAPGQTMKSLQAGGWSGERDLLTKQGSAVPTLETVKPLSDEAGELAGYVCTVRDIRERREREQALQESEERYRTLVGNVNDPIVVNVGELRAFVNRAYLDLIGLEDDGEVIGARIDKFIVPEDREGVTRRSLARQRGEEMEAVYEHRIRRADGEIRTVQTSAVATTFEGKQASLAILRDVTAFRQAEQNVRARSDELQALFNVASVLSGPGLFSSQVTTVLEELMRLLDVESADLRVPDDQEKGLVVLAAVGSAQLAPGTFRAYDDSRTGRVFLTGDPVISHEFAADHRGGVGRGRRVRSGYVCQSAAWMPVKAVGKIVGVVAVDTSKPNHFTAERVRLLTAIVDTMGPFIEDANLREEMQQHVREVETGLEQLQALFNVASVLSSPGTLSAQVTQALEEVEGIAEVDSAHLRVLDDKEAGLRLVAAVGRGVNCRPPEAFSPFGETRSGQAFKAGEPIIENDYSQRPGRGRAIAAYGSRSAAWLPVKAGGRTVGVLTVVSADEGHFTPHRVRVLTAIASDLGTFVENARLTEAERLHIEELEATLAQLRSAQQQLIQSEKLAAVGTLISGVAHEINNPLGNILGRVQLLQRAAAGDDESKRDLQTVRDECDRAIRIVRNLLSFTREHMPETMLVSLNDVIDQVLELRAYELKVSNIELRKDIQADLPEISADPHQLQQVFLNLVINAEQAMTAANGRGVLSITAQQVGEAIHVVVADDGPGIPHEHISQIFDPFFTTKEVGKGTGLGLSVCYGIVKEHGGEMHVESEEGKGTTFTVELPLPPQG